MNNLQDVTLSQPGGTIGVARNNVPIALDNHASRTDLQLLKQGTNAQPTGDFLFFPVDLNLHWNKKTVPTATTRRWPGNTVLSRSRSKTGGTFTFTLPYAGATRIRFEGLPVL